MKWYSKTFLWISAGCLGATATAQEPARPLFTPEPHTGAEVKLVRRGQGTVKSGSVGVTLGKPTPLVLPNRVIASSLSVFKAGPSDVTGELALTGVWQAAAPTVVRASSALLEDEPGRFDLPREFLPPVDEPRGASGSPIAKSAEQNVGAGTVAVQARAPVPPKDNARILELNSKAKTEPTPFPLAWDLPCVSDSPGNIAGADQVSISESFFGGRDGEQQWYGSAEWLFWWTKGFHLPPLVTTASPLDPEATRGALGMGSTRILFGNSDTSSDPRSGVRFTLGNNLDNCGILALEASGFYLGRKSDSFLATSSQFPVLARPFFDLNTGMQDRQLTTSPGIAPGDLISAVGSIQVKTSSQLWGAEVNLRGLLCCGCNWQVSGLVGFRYLDLREDVNITEQILALKDIPAFPGAVPTFAGDRITVFDDFRTQNRFYGGQVGLNGAWQTGRWSVDTRLKIGLGATNQSVDISGNQSILSPAGQRLNFVGGLLALNSNIGDHSQTRFSVVPELGLKVGYSFNESVRVFVGYDFLYWSNVVRPGDQIDQGLDITRIPNSGAAGAGIVPISQARPAVLFRTSSYWAQGVTAGVEFRY